MSTALHIYIHICWDWSHIRYTDVLYTYIYIHITLAWVTWSCTIRYAVSPKARLPSRPVRPASQASQSAQPDQPAQLAQPAQPAQPARLARLAYLSQLSQPSGGAFTSQNVDFYKEIGFWEDWLDWLTPSCPRISLSILKKEKRGLCSVGWFFLFYGNIKSEAGASQCCPSSKHTFT